MTGISVTGRNVADRQAGHLSIRLRPPVRTGRAWAWQAGTPQAKNPWTDSQDMVVVTVTGWVVGEAWKMVNLGEKPLRVGRVELKLIW